MLFKKHPVIYSLIISPFILYIILLVPLPSGNTPEISTKKPFVWNQDELWNSLEIKFISALSSGCDKLNLQIDSLFNEAEVTLNKISQNNLNPVNNSFNKLESLIFELAPLVGACNKYFQPFVSLYSRMRNEIKEQSQDWDLNSVISRNTIYRLLYGGRTAIEEIMLQMPNEKVPSLIKGIEEFSTAPGFQVLGITVHSGDILVSRGGAPTSALIARGNDYPGNFSHVALAYVDSRTNNISIIESHIERGVTISSLQEYLNDKKLRILVLRPRFDLQEISSDSMLPHKVATYAYKDAQQRHIPYDFEMNYKKDDKFFCSEVVSANYKKYGINLWKVISIISSPGTRQWLSDFGVKYFETQEPSDLEYDPQLTVVAEWRDSETLYKDHLDNAVTEIMLEEADSGKTLSYSWFMLPVARVVKLYCIILNQFEKVGPIPEGMSPEAALKNSYYSDEHNKIKNSLVKLADEFKKQKGYTPPYWELLRMSRIAKLNLNKE